MRTRPFRFLFIVVGLSATGFGFVLSHADAPVVYPSLEYGNEAQRWLFNQRAYPLGSIPVGATERAWRASLKAIAPGSAKSSSAAASAAAHWENIGPGSIIGGQIVDATDNPHVSGRILDIAVDSTQPETHWFVATDGGGVWETANGGASWTSKTDAAVSLATNTVAIAPSNPQILFAGTRDISGMGVGLLKSIDGGASWTLQAPSVFVNQTFFHFVTAKIHPTNPNTVLVVTSEVFNPGGVFKSTDGGANFALKLRGNGNALQINPTNFAQQYAAIRNNFDGWDNSHNGVFRSIDGGDNWIMVNGPWDVTGEGRDVKMALAPSDPATLYIVVPGGGMWKTQDAWALMPTWTALPAAPNGHTDFDVVLVDPTDPSVFYAGGSGDAFYRLAGESWSPITHSTHVDQHAMAAAGNTLLLGNDGGFWMSADQGTTWTNRNTNLATVEFYAGSLHPTDATAALGGSQDNGTEVWSGDVPWTWTWAGDGGHSAFSFTNPDASWLVCAQFLDLYKVTNRTSISGGNGNIDRSGSGFIAPVRRSPHGDVVLAGADNLWKSTDFFTATTPTWTSNGPEMGSEISAIAFAPSDSDSLTYAFGTGNGALRLTRDGGATWSDLDLANTVADRFVKAIAFHPTKPAIIYVALSGFDSGTPGHPGHIFVTANATAANPSWTNVSPPVDLPMNALAIDPNTPDLIFAGADLGVWKSINAGASWTFMGPASGMPNLPVLDLLFSPVDGRLVAYTYGRGAFQLKAPVMIISITHPDTNTIHLQCVGVPSRINRIEVSQDLSPNSFTTLTSLMADANGAFEYDDTNAGTQGFYRIAYP